MKNIIILTLILIASHAVAQDAVLDQHVITYGQIDTFVVDSSFWGLNYDLVHSIYPITDDYHIRFSDTSEGYFSLSIRDDSLFWDGNVTLTESAKMLIDYCDEYWYSKIDSLQNVIDSLTHEK